MSPTKKKIYIGIIVICFGVSGFLIYSTFGGSSASQVPAPVVVTNNNSSSSDVSTANNTPANAPIVAADGSLVYKTPVVFPTDSKFNWSVLNSSRYQDLNQDPDMQLDPSQIGRDDPLKPF